MRDDEDDLPGGDDDPDNEAPRPGRRAPAAAKPKAPPPEPDDGEGEEDVQAPARHEHIPRLVKLARSIGIAQAEIDATPTEQLWLAVQNEHAMSVREREARHPDPAPAKPAAKDDADEELDFEVEDVAEDGSKKRRKAKISDYDPIVQKLHRENKDLKAWREAKEKADAAKEQTGLFGMIDEAFEGLGDDVRSFFGDGTVAELGAAGAADELERRKAVVGASGIKPGDSQRVIDRKIKAGLARVYPAGVRPAKPDEEPEGYAAAPKNGKPKARPTKVERWRESTVARPSGRRGSALPRGREAADKAVRDWMVEHGHDPGPASDTAEHDDLPGDEVI